MKSKIAALFVPIVFAGAANSAVDLDVVIKKIGAQGNNVYFSIEGGFQAETCNFDVVYIPANTTFGKFAFATLLTSKTMDEPVKRVVYFKDPQGKCVLTLLEAESPTE